MIRIYRDLEEITGAALLVTMCAVAVAKVASRYILASPVTWAEEAATILFSWVVFIGASLALKKNEHFSMDVAVELLPSLPKKIVRAAGLVIVLLFCLLIVGFGLRLAVMNWHVKTPVLEISRAWLYLAVPFGGTLMLLRTGEALTREWRSGEETSGDRAGERGGMSGLIQVLILCFVALLLVGVPISIALVLSAATAMAFAAGGQLDLTQIPLQLYESTNSFPLLAVPFFILAGSIMSRGGMSERLIDLARSLVGRMPGGVAMVSVVACMFFAAVSGSTAATTAAIGIVLIPAMIQSGFSRGAATGLQATAGSIGIIIPPSIPFVLLGVIASISIGDLFLGGILPGIAIGTALIATAWVVAKIQKHSPSSQRTSMAHILRALRRSVLPLMTVVFVVGGIMCGMVTPTEAAIVAVVWSLAVSGAIYRELSLTDFYESLVDTVKVTGIVVLCIGATAPFAWLLTVEQVPQDIARWMTAMTSSPILLKLMMLLILLAIGTFIDLTPAMILLVPILMPIAKSIGMDPVHFGVMLILALGIGQSTPPVGISLFVACSVGKAKMSQVALPLLPFLSAMIAVLLIVAFWAPMTTWLPNVFMD